MITLGYIGAFLVGLVLGLLGGGGSILSVPVLTYLFGLPASEATVYSLFLVGIASFMGTLNYLPKKLVELKAGSFFLVPSVIGVTFVRRVILPAFPAEVFRAGGFVLTKDRLILLVFALVMGIASYSMLRPNRKDAVMAASSEASVLVIAAYGFGAGMLMGFVGAGGGFLIIPVLVGLARLEMKAAIGTSLFIITVGSLFGFAGDVLAGVPIDWHFLMLLTALSVVGVVTGARLSARISGARLKRSFGVLVAVIAILILVTELRG